MDLNKMQQAADLLVGEHDFRNFCRMDALQVHNYRRRVLLSRITAVPKCAPLPPERLTQSAGALSDDLTIGRSR
jgi:hypothetical protein